jgi:hypothetical protein
MMSIHSVHRTAAAGSDCVDYVTAPLRPVTWSFDDGGNRAPSSFVLIMADRVM